MKRELEALKDRLHEGGFSCVICQCGEERTFTQRGVADLYDLLTKEPAFLSGALMADKVVGKGAAALMALGGIAWVYADVISLPALDLLERHGVGVAYGQAVGAIANRRKDGRCPVETLCDGLSDPRQMFPLIESFVLKMRAEC